MQSRTSVVAAPCKTWLVVPRQSLGGPVVREKGWRVFHSARFPQCQSQESKFSPAKRSHHRSVVPRSIADAKSQGKALCFLFRKLEGTLQSRHQASLWELWTCILRQKGRSTAASSWNWIAQALAICSHLEAKPQLWPKDMLMPMAHDYHCTSSFVQKDSLLTLAALSTLSENVVEYRIPWSSDK